VTVAHDSIGGSGSSTAIGNLDHTHTPVGTLRSVVVKITQAASGDQISGVTYGGVAMTRVPTHGFANRTTTETCATYTYHLGASIPTGPQTVRAVSTGAAAKAVRSYGATAAADTVPDVANSGTGLAANPSLSLSPTAQAMLYYALASGLNTPVSTPQAGTTQSHTQDLGAISGHYGRKSVAGAGATTIGWTAASDDFAHSAVAIREQSGGGSVTGDLEHAAPAATLDATGTLSLTGDLEHAAPTATLDVTGALSLTGELEHTAPAATLEVAGALSLTGELEHTAPAAILEVAGDVLGGDVTGDLEHLAPAATLEATGTLSLTGDLEHAAPAATSTLAGIVSVFGQLRGTSPAAVLDLAGVVIGAVEPDTNPSHYVYAERASAERERDGLRHTEASTRYREGRRLSAREVGP
jgi:hypothetical protein